MSRANTTSTSGSGGTSSATEPTSVPPAITGAAAATESAYLAAQSADAAEAVHHVLAELRADVASGFDPRPLLKSHPWMTLASAAVAGFAATAAAVPSKEQQALRKLRALERALHERIEPSETNGANHEKAAGSWGAGVVAVVLRELLAAFKPFLISLLASGFTPGPVVAEKAPNDNDAAPLNGAQA